MDDEDEEEEQSFIPQPPTPDLLKSTRRMLNALVLHFLKMEHRMLEDSLV